MKKQYQDIFNVNEIEKQKCKRSTRRIQQADGGLTSEEAQSLLVESAEQLNIQLCQPPPTEPASRQRAPQRCSNCGTLRHTRIRCPQSRSFAGSHWLRNHRSASDLLQ
ncbi:hypothetical protein PAAG_11686 [Paracoccidioides lutzii Pb01]|uniref:CCHC-type domain-containing protein n=1 Tax=Paracoccidioides lutzii (strain ATCC MYA-826 / Pb01) TaxID=502779 RepID=A0A0A2V624_PARBA|nr:hypothetical protein PAAG_11686 [Paracoccidioides lutzii Pb01]KGQ01560.1 hypothetical protein PAAG_11686 [Paracoccidioides lutzii Pb01]